MRTGDKLNNFLVTSFDESYFIRFAVGWFGSLFDISNFNGTVIVINFGYNNKSIIEKLEKRGVNFIHMDNLSNKRYITYTKISELQKEHVGNYLYYDFDGYFNSDINPLLEEHEEGKFIRSKNNNDGFVYGDNDCWNRFYDFQRFERFCNLKQSNDYFLLNDSDIKFVDNKWNYTEVTRINKSTDISFMHYAGQVKRFLNTNVDYDFSFAKKYPELQAKWQKEFEKKNLNLSRRLVRTKKPQT